MKPTQHTKPLCSVRRTRGDAGLSELTVIMLDENLKAALPSQIEGISFKQLAEEIEFEHNMWNGDRFQFQLLWQFRIKFLATLLERGVALLMNDLDAVWIQDPNTAIFAKLPNNTDIIAQRASFPFDLGRDFGNTPGKWGATICMGKHDATH